MRKAFSFFSLLLVVPLAACFDAGPLETEVIGDEIGRASCRERV